MNQNEAKQFAFQVVNSTFELVFDSWDRIPGASLVSNYCKKSYQNDPGRTLLELLLVFFMIWFVMI